MLRQYSSSLCVAAALASIATAQTTSVTIPASQDATIYWQEPGTANGAGEWLTSRWDDAADFQTSEFLARFDLAGFIPSGATIQSARIELVCIELVSTAGFPLVVSRASQSWTEGPSNAAGSEYSGAPAQALDVTASHRSWPSITWTPPIIVPGTSTVVSGQPVGVWNVGPSLNLASAVQLWLDQPAANFGLDFHMEERVRFASRENGSIAGPRLVVEYTPCPAPSNYCIAAPNSRGPGAIMGWSGTTSRAQNDFTLTCTGGIPNGFGFFFFGNAQQQTPFGNGFVCVSGNVFRLLPGDNFSLSGVAARPVDMNSGVGVNLTAGTTWNFQIKYRDVAAGGALFNYSDGLNVSICP